MCRFPCISRKNKKAMAKITSQPSAELNMLTSFTGAAEGGRGRKHNLSITRSKTTERCVENLQESLQNKMA